MKIVPALLLGLALLGCGANAVKSDAPTATSEQKSATSTANLDFEKGLEGWSDKATLAMSSGVATAAHAGKLGLRIEDRDLKLGSGLLSAPVPVVAGRSYALSFWAKTQVKNGASVYARFSDQDHKTLGGDMAQVSALQNATGQWAQYKMTVKAPEKAAFVAFWIHSYSVAQGVFELDDFSVMETTDTPPPVTPVELPVPIARKTPAYILIKVDDLVATNGGVDPRWQKLVDFAKARKIKMGLGIIANSLEKDNPSYFQWVKDQQGTGLFEFWNHGYDHKQWEEGGKTVQEFKGSTYELQKEHLQRSNQLAREKLGFPFRAFGSPYNGTDANTAKALETEPDIQTWLYGDAKAPAGKVVLDRVAASIEVATGVPNALRFAQNYNKLPERDFFLIQGHPRQWTDEGFKEFVQIVDFLTQAGAVFITPSEYVRLKRPELKLPA